MNVSTKPRSGQGIDIEVMAKLWNDGGLSTSQLAARFGLTRSAVAGYIKRNKSMFDARRGAPEYKRWGGVAPKDRKPKGRSAQSSSTADGRRLSVPGIHKARMEAARREAEEFEAGTSPLLQIHVSDEERLAKGKELHDLGLHECKWALNHGGPFLFCADATHGKRYCWHHSKRAYRPKGSA
jgi:GcrA cell cycle regulator